MRLIVMIGTAAVLSAATMVMADTAARVAVNSPSIPVIGILAALPGSKG